MPAATGDPHIERLDGVRFDFQGAPFVPHHLLKTEGLDVQVALGVGPNSETFIGRLEMILPANSRLIIDTEGLIRVDAAGFRLDTWKDRPEDGPLGGITHLNLFVVEQPEDVSGASGVLVNGTSGDEPSRFAV